ncbi:MAG: hypothetical protein V9G12_04855 [Microthrixaceae bacterium]
MRSSFECSNTRAAIASVVPHEGAGDVLGRLTHVEADLLGPDVHRMAPELDRGDLHRVAGAGRRLLEEQGHPAPVQRRGEVGGFGEVEHVDQLSGSEIVDLEEVPWHLRTLAARAHVHAHTCMNM